MPSILISWCLQWKGTLLTTTPVVLTVVWSSLWAPVNYQGGLWLCLLLEALLGWNWMDPAQSDRGLWGERINSPLIEKGHKGNPPCFSIKRLVLPARWIRSITGDKWEWFPKHRELSWAPQWSHIWWLRGTSCVQWHLSLSLPQVPVALLPLSCYQNQHSWGPCWLGALWQLPTKKKMQTGDWNAPERGPWEVKHSQLLSFPARPLSCFWCQEADRDHSHQKRIIPGEISSPAFYYEKFQTYRKFERILSDVKIPPLTFFFLLYHWSTHPFIFLIHVNVNCSHQHTLAGTFKKKILILGGEKAGNKQ